MIPFWAVRGAFCVCITDDWVTPYGERTDGPAVGETIQIAQVHAYGDFSLIVIEGRADFFETAAFRPATLEEADIAHFRRLLKVAAAPELVPV